MGNRLGISGSIIYSSPEKYAELYIEDVNHIEIGEFSDEEALNKFLEINKEKGRSFGIHSPILRSGSKYDLIEKIKYDPRDAWRMLEEEAQKMSELGAEYILIHFPYFKGKVEGNTNELIEEGLKKLSYIQNKYGIKLICEPKLGLSRCAAGINYLQNFPINIWRKYNIQLCIDIGDYLIGTGQEILNYLEKWKEFITEVHLHNVHYEENDHLWIPVHPSQEYDESSHKVEKIIRFLAECKDVTFIFEHTPETNPSKEIVEEGLKWVKEIIS
jgi:sugar phosphate isomerase/epimerase